MANILTRLRIDEVSSVDRGAGEGVKIMLMKRNLKEKPMSKISNLFENLFGGGSNNNAIIEKSIEGLAESVVSIVNEAATPEELSTELSKTFEQFGDHLKTNLAAGPAVTKKEVSDMDIKVLAKALGLAETATEADVAKSLADQHAASAAAIVSMKKMEHELRIAKANFTPAQFDFYSKMSDNDDDDGDPNGNPSKKKSFRLASHSERDTIMKAAEPPVPAHIQKMFDDNAALTKRVAELEGSGNLIALTKQATEAGLPETEGATIQKALKGDKEAVEKLLGFVKQGFAAAKAGGVFKEFGSSTGTGVDGTALDELNTLAKAQQAADPKLSKQQAFAKVYENPDNAELVQRERRENSPSVV